MYIYIPRKPKLLMRSLIFYLFISFLLANIQAQDPFWLKAIHGTNDEEGLDVCVDEEGAVVLAAIDKKVPDGGKLF